MASRGPASQAQMRRHNLSLLLHLLAEHGTASRASLAARTGLTRAAVSTLTDELMRAGLVVELGRQKPGGVGRPGSDLDLADTGPCGLGAEVGVDRLAVCAMDLRGRTRLRHEEPSAGRGSSPAPVLARLRELVEQLAARARREGLHPVGLTVAVPALVRRDTTTVAHAPNLGWRDVDLADHLGSAGLPLTVDNEADLGALAHLWRRDDDEPTGVAGSTSPTGPDGLAGGAGAPAPGPPRAAALRNGAAPAFTAPQGMVRAPALLRDFLYVSAAAGIGAAVVQDGELLRGTRGFAGELGHVPVAPSGPPCPCGGRGCLEQYAGEAALLRAAGLAGTTGGTARPDAHAGLGLLARRAADGDATARSALRAAGRAFGIALAGAVNLLDPGVVVLGGSLVPLTRWLLPPLEAELRRRTATLGEAPPVLVSPLGDDGPLTGAARSVVRRALDDPLGRAVNGRSEVS